MIYPTLSASPFVLLLRVCADTPEFPKSYKVFRNEMVVEVQPGRVSVSCFPIHPVPLRMPEAKTPTNAQLCVCVYVCYDRATLVVPQNPPGCWIARVGFTTVLGLRPRGWRRQRRGQLQLTTTGMELGTAQIANWLTFCAYISPSNPAPGVFLPARQPSINVRNFS